MLPTSPVHSISPKHEIESTLRVRFGSQMRVKVDFGDEGIVLSGEAPTFYAKQMAQHLAMKVGNQPVCSNKIQVP